MDGTELKRMRVDGYNVAVLVLPPDLLGELAVLGNAMFTKATQRRSINTHHVWQMTEWWKTLLANNGYLPTRMVGAIWKMSHRTTQKKVRELAAQYPDQCKQSCGYYLSPELVAQQGWNLIGWPAPENMDGLYLVPFPRAVMDMLRLELRSSREATLSRLGEQLADGWIVATRTEIDISVLKSCASTLPPVVRCSRGMYHAGDVRLLRFNGLSWRKP